MEPLYREVTIWLCIGVPLLGGFYAFLRANKIRLKDFLQPENNR